jgi:hypothetical protein
VFTLSGEVILWRYIKQSCIADSTMEAEYVAASDASKQAVWLWKFLRELGVVPNMDKSLIMYCDNSEEISQCKERRNLKKGKHIERKYHMIREFI